jgi:hypothetical protein
VKKTRKKLTLNRETLRHLEENTLMAPVGGAVTQVDCTFVIGCVSNRLSCRPDCSAAVACTVAVNCTATV